MHTAEVAMAQYIDKVTRLCDDPNTFNNHAKYVELAKQNPIRCEAQFTAEIGDYEIIIIADTTDKEYSMQKFHVKV